MIRLLKLREKTHKTLFKFRQKHREVLAVACVWGWEWAWTSFPAHTQKPHGAREHIQKSPASRQHHKGWKFGLFCSLLWPRAYNRA